MTRELQWRTQPHERVFQVFDRRRRCVGAWTNEDTARATLAIYRGGRMLVVDEYRAKMPHYWHIKRVVIAEIR